MNVRTYTYLTVALSMALAGCRNNALVSSQIDSMRSEYLALENDYFALEDEYFAKCRELEACRLGPGESKPAETSGNASDDIGGSSNGVNAPPRIEFGTPGSPEIEFGTPVEPDELESDDLNGGAGLDGPANRPTVSTPYEEISYTLPTDLHVSHIIVNPYLTAGHDFDSKPGDDGIALLVEPRNADDHLIPVAGKTSIVVLDPALDGEAARVARWEFTAEEAARRVKKGNGRERGLSFKLPWPAGPPKHSKLHVFVRMESDEGKVFEADSEFYVILPGQFSQRWTPVSQPNGPSRAMARKTGVDRSKVVSAQHATEEAGMERNVIAGSPRVVSAVALDGRKESDGEVQQASSLESKRPVWKPYR